LSARRAAAQRQEPERRTPFGAGLDVVHAERDAIAADVAILLGAPPSRLSGRYNQGGNPFQISASKTKLMSLSASKFAFISFHFLFRIEPFQWVAREKNKKIPRPPSLAR
jgi:hypothetical protein